MEDQLNLSNDQDVLLKKWPIIVTLVAILLYIYYRLFTLSYLSYEQDGVYHLFCSDWGWVRMQTNLPIIKDAYYDIYSTWTFDTFDKLGIKGPKPWIWLGNFGTVMKMGVIKFHVEMKRRYGPVYGVYFGKQPFLTIYDTSILKQIMIKDFHLFPNRFNLSFIPPPLDKVLSFLKDEHWKFVRSVVSPTFSSGKMRKMADQINKCCTTLVENLKVEADNKRTFDFKTTCDAFTMDCIASTAFGLSIDSHNDANNMFVKMARKVFRVQMSLGALLFFLAPFLVKPLSRLGVPMFESDFISFFTEVTRKAIAQRDDVNDKKHLDFLQLLLNAHKENFRDDDEEDDNDTNENECQERKNRTDGGDADDDDGRESHQKLTATSAANKKGLTNEEILAQCLLFFLVGFETTSITLSYFVYNMACYPVLQEKLYEEIVQKIGKEEPTYDSIKQLTYLDMCLNETLRMFPVATRTDRVASQDVTINGLFIPKDMVVLIPIYALQNDPDYWHEPHVFNPERFSPDNCDLVPMDPMRFMPFGAGPRNCVGVRLAKMEVKMAAAHVIRNFRFVVSHQTDVPPVFEKFTIKNVNGIKIGVEGR